MNIITSTLSGALALALTAGVFPPVIAAPIAVSPAFQSSNVTPVQFNENWRRDRNNDRRDGDRRNGFERRGDSAFYKNHRGYRERRQGYREYNGFWFPPAAFIAGAIFGGALNDGPHDQQRRYDRTTYRISRDHVAWCSDRWRTYRVSDNSYQPNVGPRRDCTSPFG